MVWRKESHTDFFTSQERVPSQTHTPGSDVTCQSLYHVSIVSRLIPSRSRIYYMYRNNSQLHDGRDAPVTRGHTFAPHYHHSSYTGHCSLVAHWSVYSELAAAACRVVAREHSRQTVTLLRLTAACHSRNPPSLNRLPRLQTYSTYQTSFPHRLPTLHVLHSRPSERRPRAADRASFSYHFPSLVRVQVDDILRLRLLPRCSRWHGCRRGC